MQKPAKVKHIDIPCDTRIICISDIHGELDLFKQLLDEVKFCTNDILIILGDLYASGSQCRETLVFCMELNILPNVHILRGNADWEPQNYLTEQDMYWLADLPDIIESEDFTFVHSGLNPGKLEDQLMSYAKINNFMETAPKFDKWIVTGHWPTINYCHTVPHNNPMVNTDKKIISIDGGLVKKSYGQLNAFMILEGSFSYTHVDNLPEIVIKKDQAESGGSLNITWRDRFVEIIENTEEEHGFYHVRHLQSGKIITVPEPMIWKDNKGNICICDLATDYHLPCKSGDTVSLVKKFKDRIFAKINGVSGWIMI